MKQQTNKVSSSPSCPSGMDWENTYVYCNNHGATEPNSACTHSCDNGLCYGWKCKPILQIKNKLTRDGNRLNTLTIEKVSGGEKTRYGEGIPIPDNMPIVTFHENTPDGNGLGANLKMSDCSNNSPEFFHTYKVPDSNTCIVEAGKSRPSFNIRLVNKLKRISRGMEGYSSLQYNDYIVTQSTPLTSQYILPFSGMVEIREITFIGDERGMAMHTSTCQNNWPEAFTTTLDMSQGGCVVTAGSSGEDF